MRRGSMLCLLILLLISSPLSAAEPVPEKVFLLGLDGATWRILLPMMEQGMLPNLQRLIADGCHGVLYSKAAYSPISWNSILTGTGRNDHGITGLYTPDLSGTQPLKPPRDSRGLHVASTDRQRAPVWRQLAAAGHRVGVLYFLTTYPADQDTTAFISGDTTPNLIGRRGQTCRLEAIEDGGRRVYTGRIHGAEARLVEQAPGRFELHYPGDPDGEFGRIGTQEPAWLELRLDEDLTTFFATMTDVTPRVAPADWASTGSLQLSLPSSVSPRYNGVRRNRPLLVLLEGDRRLNRARFALTQDPAALTEQIEIYGVPVRAEVRRAPADAAAAGEVRLVPQVRGAPELRLAWPAGSGERPIELTFDGATGGDSTARLLEWAAAARRRRDGSPTAFLGLSQSRLRVTPRGATLHVSHVYDSFHRPAYRWFWPPDLLRDLPLERLPRQEPIEIHRHLDIKETLFEHVFRPDRFDVFMLCLTSTDAVQHFPWNSPDPRDLDLSKHNQIDIDRWLEVDGIVGRLLERLGPEWAIVVASDHGFHPIFYRRKVVFQWNRLLQQLGLLEARPRPLGIDEPQTYVPARSEAYRLELTYRCSAVPRSALKGSLQLKSLEGEIVYSERLVPGNQSYPTSRWRPGTLVRTVQDLAYPESVPPGRYRLILWSGTGAGRQGIELGSIEIPKRPRSLIMAEPLLRIGDVEVLEESAITAGRARRLTAEVELVDWSLKQVDSRYMAYLESCAPRLIETGTRAIYYDDYDVDGSRVPRDGIYLVGEPRADDSALLDELADLARSIVIQETGRALFSKVRIHPRHRMIECPLDPTALGSESGVGGIATLTYDAAHHVTFELRGRRYRFRLAELLRNHVRGFHENEGVYSISGPRVPRRGVTEQAREWDIAPTLLEMMGQPVPSSMRGRPIPWRGVASPMAAADDDEEAIPNEELLERLRSIGYLGDDGGLR